VEIRELKDEAGSGKKIFIDNYLSFIIKLYIFIKITFMMNMKFNRVALFITSILVAFFIYLLINLRSSGQSGKSKNGYAYSLPNQDTLFRNAFYSYDINDSLPYYQYKKAEDSVKGIAFEIDQENKGFRVSSSEWSFIGFSKLRNSIKLDERKKTKELILKNRIDSIKQVALRVNDPDSIAHLASLEKEVSENGAFSKNDENYETLSPDDFDYFITLKGYKIPADDKFFVQNGHYYIAHLVRDSIKKNDSGEWATYFKRNPVKARYHEIFNTISIPVSRKWYSILNSASFIIVILFWVVFAYIIFGLPASILLSISRGKAFTEQNIRDMKIIYRFLLVYGIFKSIHPYLEEWAFAEYIKGNFIGTTGLNSFYSSLPFLISGIAVFLVSKAFQKGYKLQQEEDFTV
jgi:hypothetical protein